MSRRKRLCAGLLALTLLATSVVNPAASAAQTQAAMNADNASMLAGVPYFTEPSLSPDRSEIAFVSGGDIWTVSANGGAAQLLISHPANESRPLYSPDGRQLAFVSTRTGGGDIYLLTFDSGELRRLTFDDASDQLDNWSRDGRWLYFSSTSRDIAGMNDVFRVSPQGGTPMQVSADRYTNEFFAAPAPDNSTVAFNARGIASAQWWRKGHSHLDESEIWLLKNVDGGTMPTTYERVTEGGAKELWPMWSADGRKLFYVSDRGGAQNVWARSASPDTRGNGGDAPKQLTKFAGGRVLWPSISYDGRALVFEHDFRIWKLDTNSGEAREVAITRRGAPAGPGVEHLRLTEQIQELALAPDGKKIAFVMRGEVFAASATDGGDAARITTTAAEESQLAWSPDSRRLAYVSDRDGAAHLYLYDFAANTETRLTNDALPDDSPRFSPDGKQLAFERAGRELRVLRVEQPRNERVVASGTFDRPPILPDRPFVWSPDSRWIAYMPLANKLFRNVFVVPAIGDNSKAAGQPVSFLANVGSNTVSWSADGTFILFDTGQRTESGQLARVDLIPRTPKFREDQFRDLFREETPKTVAPAQEQRQQVNPPATTPAPNTSPAPNTTATPAPASTPDTSTTTQAAPSASPAIPADAKKPATKPVEIVFDGLRRRLSLLPVGVDVEFQTVSPDGKWVALIASAANQQNLYIYSLDELAREQPVAKQLTSTAGSKAAAQFSPDSKEIYFLENGRVNIVTLDARQRLLAVAAEMDVDFAREKMEIFAQGWTYLRDHFYDPAFHGLNWETVRADYEPRIVGARTPDELRRLMQLMVGELNASHSGVSAPPSGLSPSTGRLGLRFDRAEYERNGRLRINEIIPLSPAALIADLKPGDYLLAVDGKNIDARINLDELLAYKMGRRVNLVVSSSIDGANRREVAVRPVNAATEKALLYRKWVEDNRAYVTRASNGRLGYVHMFDMGAASLAQLYVDLDAENHNRDGVVVDVRNNNGGFVNVYAIDVLARRGYLTMTPRNQSSAPARTVLGQRALELPTVLVTNQHSLSDAEDFSEGYRALRLGKIVGEPTAGWIIYTWNQSLIDGSTIRLPRMKITANDGTNMERSPRPVDIPITRTIGETTQGRDTQLDAAVRELLKQLGDRRANEGSR